MAKTENRKPFMLKCRGCTTNDASRMNALAFPVHGTQIVLSLLDSLLRRLLVPLPRLEVVLLHALAIIAQQGIDGLWRALFMIFVVSGQPLSLSIMTTAGVDFPTARTLWGSHSKPPRGYLCP